VTSAERSLAAEQPASPVTAEIEVRVQRIIIAANHDDALARDVEHAKIAGTVQHMRPAGVEPAAPENRLLSA
jgi:hypothetical protein